MTGESNPHDYSTHLGMVKVPYASVVRALGFSTGSRYGDYVLFMERFHWWRARCLGDAPRKAREKVVQR